MAKSASILLLLVLACCYTGSAVDIFFYPENFDCRGASYAIRAAEKQVCYVYNRGGASVEFSNMNNCLLSNVYTTPNCGGNPGGNGRGNFCYFAPADPIAGAGWGPVCRRRSLLGLDDHVSVKYQKQEITQPTAIAYKDAATKGKWILDAPDASNLMAHLLSLEDGERADWMKAEGAEFVPFQG